MYDQIAALGVVVTLIGLFLIGVKLFSTTQDFMVASLETLDQWGEPTGWAIRIGCLVLGACAIAYANAMKKDRR